MFLRTILFLTSLSLILLAGGCVSREPSGPATREICGNGLDDDLDGYADGDDQDCWEPSVDDGGCASAADASRPPGSDAGAPVPGTDAGTPAIRTHVCLLLEWTADVAGPAHLQGCYGTRAGDGSIVCQGPTGGDWSDPLRSMDGGACGSTDASVSCWVRAPIGAVFDLNGEVPMGPTESRWAVQDTPPAHTFHGTFRVSEDTDCNGRVDRPVGFAAVPLGGGRAGSNISFQVGT